MKLEFPDQAIKNLRKIPQNEQIKIHRKFDSLLADPFLGKKLEGEFKDLRSLRAWPYRIFYSIEDNIITIYKISHRQSAYT